jgi:aminoglycoside phosphotransferase (APT) family kinase protein
VPGASWRFEPLRLAQDYLQQAADGGPADAAQMLAALAAAVECVQDAHGRDGIVHGDLVPGNLLEAGQLWLLDWEYAQVADPIYDVASVIVAGPAAAAHTDFLLAAAGMAGDRSGQRLGAAVYVYQALGWAWHLARGEPAPHPGLWP